MRLLMLHAGLRALLSIRVRTPAATATAAAVMQRIMVPRELKRRFLTVRCWFSIPRLLLDLPVVDC